MTDFEQYIEKKAENEPHEVAELICLKCLNRAIHVYPEKVLLKHLQCKCGEVGYLIKTGQTIIEADKKYEAKVITRGKCMMCGKELTEGLFFCKECGDKANSGK